MGLISTLIPFIFALGVGLDAILGVDFLNEHEVCVTRWRRCFLFDAHEGMPASLVGHTPTFRHACAVTHDVALYPGGKAFVRIDCPRSGGEIGPVLLPITTYTQSWKDTPANWVWLGVRNSLGS